jgi:hypothetical protein
MLPAGVVAAQGTPNALVGVRFPGGYPDMPLSYNVIIPVLYSGD